MCLICENLKKLIYLDISSNTLQSEIYQYVGKNLKQLTSLIISYSDVTNDDIVFLSKNLKQLRYINMNNCFGVYKNAIESICVNCRRLIRIDWKDCGNIHSANDKIINDNILPSYNYYRSEYVFSLREHINRNKAIYGAYIYDSLLYKNYDNFQ